MKNIFFIIAFLIILVSQTLPAQKIDCSCRKLPSSEQREQLKATFPWNSAKRVQIVRYDAPNKVMYGINVRNFSWDTTDFIPRSNGIVDTTRFIQQKSLSQNGIDSLLDIVLIGPRNSCLVETQFIEPKYGIIYYNAQNEIIDYLVFDIVNTENQDPSLGIRKYKIVNLGGYCSTKYLLLAEFYKQNGIDIQYTTIEYKLK